VRASGDEGSRRSRGDLHHVDLLKEEFIADGGEGREGATTAEVDPDVPIPLVEPANHVEDQSAVSHVFAEVSEVGGHLLEVFAIVSDGKITLGKGAKLGVEVESTSLLIADEVVLDGDPGFVGGGAVLDHGFSKVGSDRAVQPRFDDGVHPSPIRKCRDGGAADVVLQRILRDGEEELFAPPRVVAGGVEDEGHQTAGVLHGNSLGMEVEDGGGLVEGHGAGDVRGFLVVGVVGRVGGISRSSGVGPGFGRLGQCGADALGGCVARRGSSSGLLLGRLGFGEGGAASLGEVLLQGVGVAASLLSRVVDGGGGGPDHTAARSQRVGAAEG
jgi:hypothetical protein